METPSLVRPLVPLTSAVALVYLVIGVALPVLPLHVKHELGLGGLEVGLVAGAPFAVAIVTRALAGRFADRRGPARGVAFGLVLTALSGGLYLFSLAFDDVTLALAALLLGRGLLGAGESFVMTGALARGVALAGPLRTGQVMAWIGTAVYAAMGLGAPVGDLLYGTLGFGALGVLGVVAPLLVLPVFLGMEPVLDDTSQEEAPSLGAMLGFVWPPGLALTLSAVGFGVVTTFLPLLYAARGWSGAWFAISLFTLAFIVGRLGFGSLPDRYGGARVALFSVLVEAMGLALVGLAGSVPMALGGALLTGIGYALVYPALGVEAVRRAPAGSRGLALGTYTAFFDLSLGLSTPLLGALAELAGLPAVYGASVGLALLASLVCGGMLGPKRDRYAR